MRSPSVGLVLGGGGLVGQAFHAGALAAIAHDHGWDPRDAAVVVGTSAGAVTGALLRAGAGADDLAAVHVDAPSSLGRRFGVQLPDLPPIRWRDVLRPQLPRWPLIARGAQLPWRSDPISSALAMLRDGDLDVVPHLAFLGDLTGARWPPEDLRVTATRQRDGRRVVFGEEQRPRVVEAVSASCAVPGYMRPVLIDGVAYLDGGLHSPTNADLVLDDDLDLVIVVSPLSTRSPVGWSLDALTRRVASRRLRAEVRLLERRGRRVVVVEPDLRVLEAMGADLMCAGACHATVREAFLALGRQAGDLAQPLRELLGGRRAAA